jgi:hypothetical protein
VKRVFQIWERGYDESSLASPETGRGAISLPPFSLIWEKRGLGRVEGLSNESSERITKGLIPDH